MLYPIHISKHPRSDYGVVVPDLRGCISAGRTLTRPCTWRTRRSSCTWRA